MSVVSLKGTWKLSGGNYTLTTEIPGDFHYALEKAQIIPNPLYGFNEQEVLWVGQTDWTIEKSFQFTKTDNTKSILELTEADTFLTIYINDKEIGKCQNAFSRHRFDITSHLLDGENIIKILFESPENKAIELSKKLPYPVPCSEYDVFSPHRNLVRKCQCNGGWDWGPCIMISGIYGDIFIQTVSDGIFNNLTITYELVDESTKKWEATVSTEYESYKEKDKEFVFNIKGDDIDEVTNSVTANLKVGVNKITTKLTVTNPWLWMTSGELKENSKTENIIYLLTCTEKDLLYGNVSTTKKICFNSLKTVCEDDEIGRAFYFENNGKKIFAKGSNWIPCEPYASNMTEERYNNLLQSALDSNQNTLRIWGGGIYEKDYFYDFCDKYGIIIYHDMMFACGCYPTNEEFLEEVKKELEYQIPRLQSHASIALWCGNNEGFGCLDWYEESKSNKTVYIMNYDRLNNVVVGGKIKSLDNVRLFWPSSPSSGPDDYGDNWHSDNRGDMHYWSVWHEKQSFDSYLTIKPRFVSEFGYESFPSMDCIKTFAEEKDYNFTSKLMEYHQRSPIGNSIILENFGRYYRFPNTFQQMVYLSQVQQATAIKTAIEYWRSLKPTCLGSIIWQLNDIWPGPSWSSLEYNGKWKLLHYAIKKFYEPIYLSFFIKDNQLHAFICNDSYKSLEGELIIQYIKFDGSSFKDNVTVQCSVNADETKEIYTEDISEKSNNEYFIYAELTGKNSEGEEFTKDGTVFPALYKHCDLGDCKLSYYLAKNDNVFEINVKSDLPAFYVSFDTVGLKGKFSENMFTLLANKTKKLFYYADEKYDMATFKSALSLYDLRHTYT